MTVTKNQNGTSVTLSVEGRLDTITAPELEKEIQALADATELTIDFAKLEDVPEMIVSVLSDRNARDYMDANRINAIADLTRKRIEHLRRLAGSHDRSQTIDLNDDVTENAAEDYNND